MNNNSWHRLTYGFLASFVVIAVSACQGGAVSGNPSSSSSISSVSSSSTNFSSTSSTNVSSTSSGISLSSSSSISSEGGGVALNDELPVIRRLTSLELQRSLSKILGVVNLAGMEPEFFSAGLARVGGREVIPSASGIERYDFAITRSVDAAWRDDDKRNVIIGCSGASQNAACVTDFIQRVGTQAWRRPLTSVEQTRYRNLFTACEQQQQGDFSESIRCVLDGLLRSPNFYYRVEVPTNGVYTGYDMASRLSYFLWSLPPDDVLLEAAATGQLDTAAGVRAQATRMLENPLAREGFKVFVDEWFRLDRIDRLERDIITYTGEELQLSLSRDALLQPWASQFTEAAREEFRQMIVNQVFDKDRDYMELLTTKETFVNDQLADFYRLRTATVDEDFYGIFIGEESFPGTASSTDRRLLQTSGSLSRDTLVAATHADRSPRQGLLGTMALLAQLGGQDQTSPTQRGNYILERFLCIDVGSPPPDTDVCVRPPNVSRRESIEQHHTCAPSCQGCHNQVDPIGFALDEFDTIGRHRESDGVGFRIDNAVDLTLISDGNVRTLSFDGLTGLAEILKDQQEANTCIAKQIYRFATGLEEKNNAEMDELAAAFVAGGRRIKGFLVHFVGSDAFRKAEIDDDAGANATLTTVVDQVFAPYCGVCHISTNLGGLNLANDGNLRSRLLGDSAQLPSMPLVTPADITQSYLWHKLNNSHIGVGGSGDQMPQTAPLSERNLSLIRSWIGSGAL